MVILALDPSTDVTGVALIDFDKKGSGRLIACGAYDATAYHKELMKNRRLMQKKAFVKDSTDEARFERISYTRNKIRTFVSEEYPDPDNVQIDYVAFETPNANRGAVGAINQAIGAYLCTVNYGDARILPIHASTAKSVSIGAAFRQSGQTSKTLMEKERMVTWANLRFGIDVPGGEGEAIADACAIAVAAWQKTYEQAVIA